jgi:dephospho-CoA kinase
MLKVGLTGGIASGKSFVGRAFEELGCLLIGADDLGHHVLEADGEAFAAVAAEFGPEVVAAGGGIDRAALASIVFRDAERLNRLNQLVHPSVIARERKLLAEFAAREPKGIAMLEAAILIELGTTDRFDKIVLVTCTPEQQIERAMRREGASERDVRARIESQMQFEEKRKFADFIIDTSAEKEDTIRQTRAVWEQLRRIES